MSTDTTGFTTGDDDGMSWYEGKGFPPGTFRDEDGNAPEAKAGVEGDRKEPRRG